MKRNLLFASMLAFLFMAGCSQEEITPKGEGGGNGQTKTSYMAVNLMSSDVAKNRAADGYEDGSDDENKVTKVRFYFFNGLGGAVNVKLQGNNYVNYYDWTPGSGDQNPDADSDDIGSVLTAMIVINTADGDGIPQKIAAVLNPTDDLTAKGSLNLTSLQKIVGNYSDPDLTKAGKFVMFNSIYGKDGAEVCAVPIEAKHLCKSEAEAKASPVKIYVERSVAKVRVTLGNAVASANGEGSKLALKDKEGNDIKVGGQQVYLKLSGWSLTAETSEGRLVKKINPGWSGWNWNSEYRSFWAINSMTATNEYKSYNAIGGTSFGSDHALYTNENAQQTDIDNTNGKATEKTKVILKGTLCKEDGTPFTIVRHLGAYFADTESGTEETANLPKLKESILNQMAANGDNYYFEETVEGGKKQRTQIVPTDLQIVIATMKNEEDSQNNCYVYAQLTDAAADKTWYTSLAEDAQPLENATTVINGKLADKDKIDRALVWKSGMTYYFYEIKHLADNIGVVRNHIYATNVTNIAGLGTPVYDPDKIVYPEVSVPNDHYIAAEINILSWRVVSNDYELKW